MLTPEHYDGTATMAATSENKVLPKKAFTDRIIYLHGMFRIVGDQMSQMDVRVLKFLYRGIFSKDLMSGICDGYSFLLALENTRVVDDSNFYHLLHLLRKITRHDLTQYVTLRRRPPATSDPVAEYLEHSSKSHIIVPFQKRSAILTKAEVTCSWQSARNDSDLSPRHCDATPASDHDNTTDEPAAKKHKTHHVEHRTDNVIGDNKINDCTREELKKKVTCDIRLRVRAEYCHHDAALEGNVHSNKPDLIERQFEKFMQANTILKSRDLGSIMCDIKFSELTYLDAFWRDYINGSLLEALKGVFITDSLKQAVGHESIKLLVNVDEDDYETGRVKLLQNLSD